MRFADNKPTIMVDYFLVPEFLIFFLNCIHLQLKSFTPLLRLPSLSSSKTYLQLDKIKINEAHINDKKIHMYRSDKWILQTNLSKNKYTMSSFELFRDGQLKKLLIIAAKHRHLNNCYIKVVKKNVKILKDISIKELQQFVKKKSNWPKYLII